MLLYQTEVIRQKLEYSGDESENDASDVWTFDDKPCAASLFFLDSFKPLVE